MKPEILFKAARSVAAVLFICLPQIAAQTLQGRVTDSTGSPVPGAVVQARMATDESPWHRPAGPGEGTVTQASADGQWSLSDLAPGMWIVTAMASTDGGAGVGDGGGSRSEVDTSIPEGASVARTILCVAESPAWSSPECTLVLDVASGTDRVIGGRLTGMFNPDAFAYEVRILSNATFIQTSGTVTMTVTGGTETTLNQPVTYSAVPNEVGEFQFGKIRASRHDLLTVHARPIGSCDSRIDGTVLRTALALYGDPAVESDIDIAIEMDALHAVSLTAVSEELLPDADGKSHHLVNFMRWDEQGGQESTGSRHVTWHGLLRSGTYLVRAEVNDQFASAIAVLVLDGKGGATRLELPLMPCRSLEVTFKDDTGAALALRRLTLGVDELGDSPRPYRVFVPISNGLGMLSGVLPGEYPAEILAQDGTRFRARVRVVAGESSILVTRL